MADIMTTNNHVCSFCGKKIEDNAIYGHGYGDAYICPTCIAEFGQQAAAASRYLENAEKVKGAMGQQKSRIRRPSEIKAHLDEYIEGQEYAKRVISVAVYNHYKMLAIKMKQKNSDGQKTDVELEKSNILLAGPSGSGKTAIIRAIAKRLRVPLAIIDITSYSSTGYVGRDVECILRELLSSANGKVEAAERGIVYIDEIDKTSRKGENLSTTSDPGHEGVQQALLKLLEGSRVEVPEKNARIRPDETNATVINTENILFIVGGAFEGVEKIIAQRLRSEASSGTMGFGSQLVDKKNQKYNEYIEKVTTEDFKKFGMLPELLGRVPVIAPLKELTEEQLTHILYRPKNALVKQYQELLRHDGVALEFTEEALKAIANLAIKRKTGARGLRGIMEDLLNPVMYEVPDRSEDTVIVHVENDELKIKYETRKMKKEAV